MIVKKKIAVNDSMVQVTVTTMTVVVFAVVMNMKTTITMTT